MDLITRNLFIDNQHIISKSLDFDNSELSSLKDKASKKND